MLESENAETLGAPSSSCFCMTGCFVDSGCGAAGGGVATGFSCGIVASDLGSTGVPATFVAVGLLK